MSQLATGVHWTMDARVIRISYLAILSQLSYLYKCIFFWFCWVIDQSRTIESDLDDYARTQAKLIVFWWLVEGLHVGHLISRDTLDFGFLHGAVVNMKTLGSVSGVSLSNRTRFLFQNFTHYCVQLKVSSAWNFKIHLLIASKVHVLNFNT